jgi:hypothetical protein
MNNTIKKRCVTDFQMDGCISAKTIISERRKMHMMPEDDFVSADDIKAALG